MFFNGLYLTLFSCVLFCLKTINFTLKKISKKMEKILLAAKWG